MKPEGSLIRRLEVEDWLKRWTSDAGFTWEARRPCTLASELVEFVYGEAISVSHRTEATILIQVEITSKLAWWPNLCMISGRPNRQMGAEEAPVMPWYKRKILSGIGLALISVKSVVSGQENTWASDQRSTS